MHFLSLSGLGCCVWGLSSRWGRGSLPCAERGCQPPSLDQELGGEHCCFEAFEYLEWQGARAHSGVPYPS